MQINDTLQLACGLEIPYISEDDYAQKMRTVVEHALKRLRSEQEVPVKGGTLHAENYVVPDAKHAVVLVHGFTESAEKLREMVWYFIKAGFSVFSYDQRGHGRSLRHVKDPSTVHVNSFSDYVDDLETFIKVCVLPAVKEDVPLCLFAHSMGGAVGAQYLLRHPDFFKKAVLNSPMIAPASGNIPMWVGYAIAQTMVMSKRGEERAFISGPFDPATQKLETSCSTSAARFNYYLEKRIAAPRLQTNAPTYRWAREAVVQSSALLKKGKVSRIKTPILLCQAGSDDQVRLPEQQQFVDMVPGAKLVRFEGSRHEIFNSTDDVMKPYVTTLLDYLLDC